MADYSDLTVWSFMLFGSLFGFLLHFLRRVMG